MPGTILVLILSLVSLVQSLGCERPKVFCLSEDSFTLNVTIFEQVFDFGLVLKCPEGFYCHQETDTPCKSFPQTTTTLEPPTTEDTSTEPTTTTTTPKPPVSPPKCKAEGYHQANKCNQYYECVRALFWYDARLRTCPTGTFYSSTKQPCDKPPNVVCTN